MNTIAAVASDAAGAGSPTAAAAALKKGRAKAFGSGRHVGNIPLDELCGVESLDVVSGVYINP